MKKARGQVVSSFDGNDTLSMSKVLEVGRGHNDAGSCADRLESRANLPPSPFLLLCPSRYLLLIALAMLPRPTRALLVYRRRTFHSTLLDVPGMGYCTPDPMLHFTYYVIVFICSSYINMIRRQLEFKLRKHQLDVRQITGFDRLK